MPAHLLEAAIILTLAPDEDRIDRRLHVVVDAALASAAEERERPIMRVEHHLLARARIAPGAHAVLLLDQAGWVCSEALVVPHDITLLPLPSKCPELDPVENVWRFMRDNWLSNRILRSYDDIRDPCCFARNRLFDQLWRITRKWAHAS